MAALGRPFQVGMLYDCRTDSLIPDVSLWDLENLKKDLKIKPQNDTQFNIITLDSLDEKTSILNMTASLKASFLCGLIKVDGAAKYLNNTKSSKQQSRVTLHYSTTTRMEQLTMSHLGNQNIVYPEVFEEKSATHVVTGVLYGAQAFFVFDQWDTEVEQNRDNKGKLETLIKKYITVDGKRDLKMTDVYKETADHLNFTFYGDFLLDHNPTSFQDAMQIYNNLPKQLSKDDKLAVPVQVWLYPLKHLNSWAARLVQEISVALVSKSQEVLEELDEHIMRCNDIMKDGVVNNFTIIRKNVNDFKSNLNHFKYKFQRELARVLPNIRGGDACEGVVTNILKNKEESPFKKCVITTWLDKRQKEITMLRNFFNRINEMRLDIVINDLDTLIYNTSIKNIVCLTFTSLHVCHLYISEMERYHQAPSRKSSYHLSEPSEELIIQNFRQHSQRFIEFAEINQSSKTTRFLVHSIPDVEYLGATIYLYKYGRLINHNFQLPSKLETLVVESQTEDSVTLMFRPPKCDIEGYRVEYKRLEDEEWKTVNTTDKSVKFTIRALHPASTYQLRHRAVCQVGVSQASDTIEVRTLPVKKPTGRHAIKDKCNEIKGGNLRLYLLPLNSQFINTVKKIETCSFGNRTSMKPSKTIMVLGATGSGKSTLINGMVNFILGVQWEDDFRFKLIHEETSRSQAESQTSFVTAYEMNYQDCFMVPYSFTIVDTPGFGDTRGIDQDKQITEQIRECFSSPQGVQHINAVCFVVQASQTRLTHTQKYIFESILSIFGKDIANNILVLITFADGQRPPVLDAILESNIPLPKDVEGSPLFFKFNNSSLFANNNETNSSDCLMFNKMFWDMGARSMERFYTTLEKMDDKSLALTKEVLEERKHLETVVEGLRPQISNALSKLEVIRQTCDILNKHVTDIQSNRDFEYEVNVTETIRESIAGTGKFITNCQKCNFTCHYPCLLPNDKDKIRCAAMKNEVCTICPGKCEWNIHSNQQHRFIYETKKVKKTYDELKKKYEQAQGELMTTEQVLERLQHELENVINLANKLITECHESIKRLEEIALRPNPLSSPEYIELLIQAEEREAKPGWMERIKSLQEVKKKAIIIANLSRNEKLPPSVQTKSQKRKSSETMGPQNSKVTKRTFWNKK
ncbi:STXA protein, partial [Polypterus senegalus]|nr:STXA protein [Polypterus senegalus]